MAKVYDVVATTGTYQKDGETKYRTRNVGAVIDTKHGFRLKLDASFNPAGCPRDDDGQIWLALFEPKPRDANQQTQQATAQQYQQASGGGVDPNDQIPFMSIDWRMM